MKALGTLIQALLMAGMLVYGIPLLWEGMRQTLREIREGENE